jgi:hypothetical protein
MPNSLGSLNLLWRAVKEQIAQDVPQGIEFCEFECTRKQCTLELTGTCDIRPRQALILIKPAVAMPSPKRFSTPAA